MQYPRKRGSLFSLSLNFLFALALSLESFPSLNRVIEMRQNDSLQDKFKLIGIGIQNVLTCVVSQHIFEKLGHEHSWKSTPLAIQENQCAADFEERMLQEESDYNRKNIFTACVFGLYLVLNKILALSSKGKGS